MTFPWKNILVTGGTGSFGKAFTRRILREDNVKRLVIFSRDEMKQWEMEQEFQGDSRLRFMTGDVRDRDRLKRALDGVEVVIHAAASKIVPIGEYNPFETTKTNVLGAMHLIDACIDQGVSRVVALSTDKASSPINLYGATKLVSDKMFIAGNSYAGSKNTRFSVVRYGNVMGSRGSVIPFFLRQLEEGSQLTITDKEMTRFMITLDQGIDLVLTALETMNGGEIYVRKIPSMGILDIAEAIDPGGKRALVGVRPGEKLHEQMISREDSPNTFDFGDHFRVLPARSSWTPVLPDLTGGSPVSANFVYASDSNSEWMSIEQLRDWLHESYPGFAAKG